jgi:hypothetical protein
MLEDAAREGRCIRKDALIAIIKYRDAVVEKFKADNVTKPNTGWRWPWERN